MCCDISLGRFPPGGNVCKESRGIQSSGPQIRDGDAAVRKRFVALAARCNEYGIAAGDGFTRRLALFRLKRATPQDWLGISKVALDQKLFFGSLGRKIHDGHLTAEAEQMMAAGVDHAPGGIQNQLPPRIRFEFGEYVVERGDFRS